MKKLSTIAIVGAAGVLVATGAAAFYVSQPKTPVSSPSAGRDVTVTITPTPTMSEAAGATTSPSPSASPSASASSSSWEQKRPDTYPLSYLEGETGPAKDMADAAVDYIITRHTLDFTTPYPGYDLDRLIWLSAGDEKEGLLSDKKFWANGPSGADSRFYNELKQQGYKQTVTVDNAWVSPLNNRVVVDISTKTTTGRDQKQAETWTLTMTSCKDGNAYGYCVAGVSNTPADG